MTRLLIITCCIILFTSITYAQNVGIGTTQPDASAALDITSINKGFLIPRINMYANPVAAPATGLMVYNTSSFALDGPGLYVNTGTNFAPQWERLAPSDPGEFIRNQLTVQARSNFNISGHGYIGGGLHVGSASGEPYPVDIRSNNSTETGLTLINQSSNSSWAIKTFGIQGDFPGAFSLMNTNENKNYLIANNGRVGINMSTAPTETLEVNGNIKASGNFLIGMTTISQEYSINGNSHAYCRVRCPAGYRLISGGGGHRDFNTALKDIELSYNGPDPEDPTTGWRILVENTGRSNRALIVYCICAKVQ
jgi:hypothetical protein